MNLCDQNTISKLLQKHGFSVKKFLGQNFLNSEKVVQASIDAANLSLNDYVIEIGPGLGVLTQKIAANCQKLTTIELDKKLFPMLVESLSGFDNIEIVHQDALRFEPPSAPYKVVANIPYNITSPLINHFLQATNPPQSMTLLIQKEVADKICQLDPKMSVLSLQVALFGQAKIISYVPASCFYPMPKVESAIIHIDVAAKFPLDKCLKILNLAKQAFKSGRKKLSNTLPEIKEKLSQLNLSEKRPQHLSLDDWEKLIKQP